MKIKLDAQGNELPDSAESWVMVKDNVTGLIWEVKTNDGSIHDKDNEYNWSDANSVFIAGLNAEHFGGFSDWRQPTIKEFLTLVDYEKRDLLIDENFFPNTMSSFYWSSTTFAGYTDFAWCLDFYYGGDDHYDKSVARYVRAVRGGQPGSLDNPVIS